MHIGKFNIYILGLVKNKYYVGKTHKDVSFRIYQHIKGNGSQWTKLYKPIKLVGTFETKDKFDEDKYTKKYMDLYGIENVRGGSYCQIKLGEHQLKILDMELKTANDLCFKCGKFGHFSSQCYSKNN